MPEPQTALSKRDNRDQTPDAQDSWSDAVEAKRRAAEAETQPTQPPDEARAPASLPKTAQVTKPTAQEIESPSGAKPNHAVAARRPATSCTPSRSTYTSA